KHHEKKPRSSRAPPPSPANPVAVPRKFLLTQSQGHKPGKIPHGVEVKEPNTMLLSVMMTLLPILLIGAFIWFFFIRQIKMAGKGALSFGKSKARLLAKERNKTT